MFWFTGPASAWGDVGCRVGGLRDVACKRFLNRFTAKCGANFKFIVEGDVRVAARARTLGVCVLLCLGA